MRTPPTDSTSITACASETPGCFWTRAPQPGTAAAALMPCIPTAAAAAAAAASLARFWPALAPWRLTLMASGGLPGALCAPPGVLAVPARGPEARLALRALAAPVLHVDGVQGLRGAGRAPAGLAAPVAREPKGGAGACRTRTGGSCRRRMRAPRGAMAGGGGMGAIAGIWCAALSPKASETAAAMEAASGPPVPSMEREASAAWCCWFSSCLIFACLS